MREEVKTNDPLVSVIMPVFNGENFMLTALECVKDQDYPNLEIIVVNDGSTDKSGDILSSFAQSWSGSIKILTHPDRQRHGIGASYQLGAQHCQGKYIAFLEHDDLWPPNKISEQVKVFEAFPEVGVVFANVYHCDLEGKVSVKPFKTLVNRPPSGKPFDAVWRLLWGNCVSTFSNMMVRGEHLNVSDIMPYPEGFQDWMLLLKLSFRCKFYHCSQTKTFWRQRPESYSSLMKRMPGYRRKRKLAVTRAVSSVFLEREFFSRYRLAAFFLKSYWCSAIFLLSGFEMMADFLHRRVISSQNPQSDKVPLKSAIPQKSFQTLIGLEKYS